MSASSRGSMSSGIPALDDLRVAKEKTIDGRMLVHHYKSTEEKVWKSEMVAKQLEIEKARRENIRLENKLIPDLERRLDSKKYEIYSKGNRETFRELDRVYEAHIDELSRLSFINS